MRILLRFVCGFVGGCLICVYLLSGVRPLALAGAALIPVCFCLRRDGSVFRSVRLVCLGLVLACLWCWGYRVLSVEPAIVSAGSVKRGWAEICNYPRPSGWSQQAEAWIGTDDGAVKANLYLNGVDERLRPGDVIVGSFELRPSNVGSDGGEFLYYQSKGVLLTGKATVDRIERTDRLPLRYAPLWLGEQVRALLDRSVPADAAPFLKAVLTGDRGGLDFAAERDLTVAGLSHVVAVSGMHVSLLVGALYLVMGRARRAAAAIGIPLVLIFMLLTGLSPSVVRAGIMLSLLLLAPLLHRESDPPTALSAAALLILLLNPYTVANVGFQLSFLAVAGLLLLTGPLYRHLRSRKLFAAVLTRSETGLSRWRKLAHRLARRFVNGLLQILCATVGALSLTVPVTCIVFGSLPTYALLSNLLALWAVSLCFGLGLGTAALAAVWPAAGKLLGSIAAWPVRYLLLICRFVSRLPHPSLPASSPYTVAFLVFAYAVLLTVVLLRKRRYGTGLLCVLAALALTVGLRQIRAARADWTAAVLDVGQGQCVCIRCGGRTAVIDCGGSDGDKAGAHAADYLRQSGVRIVDALILSHYDTDHVGGVAELLREIDVRTVYLPAVCFAPEKREALEAAASAHGAAVIPVSADLCLPFGSGSLQLFAPVGAENDNDGSVSVLFSERDYDMLVTGDLDQAGEHRLLAAHDLPDIEAFVAGHHGAESSSGMELLKTLRPETVLISVGRNRYGHPSESALARFAAIGAEVLRTDESGDLELKR